MLDDRKVGLAITHYNRFSFLLECLYHVRKDPRIAEITIVDDASNDGSWELLLEKFGDNPRYRLFRNNVNLDCYRNKAQAVTHAVSDWIILFDSDNTLLPSYLDTLFSLEWVDGRAYCPDFAQPHFDYTAFSGVVVDASNVGHFMHQRSFITALNTANYFFQKKEYLRVWDCNVDPITADSLFQNYNWLRQGNSLQIVKGLQYPHRVHANSHYKLNQHRTDRRFVRNLENKIRQLTHEANGNTPDVWEDGKLSLSGRSRNRILPPSRAGFYATHKDQRSKKQPDISPASGSAL